MSVKELIEKYSKPELRKTQQMVYEIWEDGEVTLQKAGDLYGQRSCHMITRPIIPEHEGLRYVSLMDNLVGQHGNIAVENEEQCQEIRAAMLEEYNELQKKMAETRS